jgi:DNA invertase Pin-like site-specific DNA recombinase
MAAQHHDKKAIRYLAGHERMTSSAPHDGLLLPGLVPVPEDRQPDAEITHWLQQQGIALTAVQWFEDIERGHTLRRPAFARLQHAIDTGAITTVVVWKLDRLARRQQDGISILVDWCARHVRVVAVTQQIDLSGPVGRMVASVLFGLAEIEWEYWRKRQAAGIVVAKAHGIYRGRQKGMTKAKPQRAQTLRQRGLTVLEIATALGVSERTVFRYLTAARA